MDHSFEPLPTSDTDQAPESTSASPQRTWKQTALILVGILLTLLVLKNALFNDYREKTKEYLRSIGKADAIDNIVPKTSKEQLLDKVSQDKLIKEMFKNVTTLQSDYRTLKSKYESIDYEFKLLKNENELLKTDIQHLQDYIQQIHRRFLRRYLR